MSHQPTSEDILKSTFAQESGSGAIAFVLPDGLILDHSGRAVSLASLSARQARDLGLLTSGTSGRQGSTLPASADLTSSLASRLQALTASLGSRVYRLTWKERAMPSGGSIPALRGLPMRKATKGSTSASEFTGEPSGWATPTTRDHKDGASVGTAPVNGLRGRQVWLVGWATPKATDGAGGRTTVTKGGGNVHLDKQARLAGWSTPTAEDSRRGEGTIRPQDTGHPLPQQASLAGWPTPMAGTPAQNGNNAAGNTDSSHKTVALVSTGSPAETASIGRLRAGHSRWLMRIPAAWDDCAPTATRSTRGKRKPSAVRSSQADMSDLV